MATQISDFHAKVGVEIDRSALPQIDKYLSDIRRRFQTFQRELSRNTNIRVTARINRTATRTALNRELQGIGRGLRVRLDNVQLNNAAIARGVQSSLRNLPAGTRIELDARLSRSSLDAMRDQVRNSISTMVLNPTINPRITNRGLVGGRRSGAEGTTRAHDKTKRMSPRSGRTFNPWYNPMMVGGGLGAFLRYGTYSLPFIAGTMGAASISSRAQQLQGNREILNFFSGGVPEGIQNMSMLRSLGNRLGFATADVSPQYGRLLAASRGTSLEGKLPQGFQSLMEYASVSGADRGQLTDLFARMVNRRQVRTTDLDTLVTAGMPVAFEAMASVVSGGDVPKLREMLKGEGLDVTEVLPKFFDELGNRSQKFLGRYYESIARNRGRAQKSTEEWFEGFMSGGVEDALADFYRVWAQIANSNARFANWSGGLFARAVNGVSYVLLGLTEISDWFMDEEREGNFMTALFGKAGDSELRARLLEIRNLISRQIEGITSDIKGFVPAIVKVFRDMAEEIYHLMVGIADPLYMASMGITGGVEGANYAHRRVSAEREIRASVRSEMPGASEPQILREIERRVAKWVGENPYVPSLNAEGSSLPEYFLSGPSNLVDPSTKRQFEEINKAFRKGMESGDIPTPQSPPWVGALPQWLREWLKSQAESSAKSIGLSGYPEEDNLSFFERIRNLFIGEAQGSTLPSSLLSSQTLHPLVINVSVDGRIELDGEFDSIEFSDTQRDQVRDFVEENFFGTLRKTSIQNARNTAF